MMKRMSKIMCLHSSSTFGWTEVDKYMSLFTP